MTTALIVAYIVVALVVSVPAGMWAEREDYVDPYALGIVLGAVWPLTVFCALGALVFGLLAAAAEAVAERFKR